MFGLSWPEIFIILAVGVFVLGPERIPVAIRWMGETVRKLRGLAANAQSDLRREIGPELDELRRQVADLQSMKEYQELKSLRDLNPKRYLQKNILGDEFSGGMSGFLGLNGSAAEQANAAVNGAATNGAATNGALANGGPGDGAAVDGALSNGTAVNGAAVNGAAANGNSALQPAPAAVGVGAANGAMLTNGGAIPAAEMSYPTRRSSRPLKPGEPAPFDSDGT